MHHCFISSYLSFTLLNQSFYVDFSIFSALTIVEYFNPVSIGSHYHKMN